MTSAADARWYALWTRSRHEQVVREQLEQKQVEAFLPTVTRWSRWKDRDRKSTRLNSSHLGISYAVFCLKKKKKQKILKHYSHKKKEVIQQQYQHQKINITIHKLPHIALTFRLQYKQATMMIRITSTYKL